MFRKPLIVLVALAALVAVPSAASSSSLRGVVVKVDSAASLLAVARENGQVELLRTRAAAAAHVGQRVQAETRRLRGGERAVERLRLLGDASQARLKGVVRAVSGQAFELDAGQVVLRVGLGTRAAPHLGARVDMIVVFAGGALVLSRMNEIELEDEDELEDVCEDDHDDDEDGGRNRGPGAGGGSGRG